MRDYVVMAATTGPRPDPDARFVPEGFSWGAFLLGPFWALWHGQWKSAIAIAAAWLALGAVVAALTPEPGSAAALQIGLALLVGWSGHDLRRWELGRGGREIDAVIRAGSLAEAELGYFGAADAPAGPVASSSSTGDLPAASSGHI